MLSATASFALPACPTSGYFNNCFGTYTWPHGEKYVGEWKENKTNGQGVRTYANGAKYVGEYKDGKKNGQGTYTYASGTVQEGIWKDDEFQKKSELDEHTDFFCTEMGLTPKTEKFEDCVLKLMDEARRRQRTLKN